MGKTSLEKSHSKASNFKLTLMCLLASISFVLLFFGLSLLNKNKTIGIVVAACGAVLFILSFIMISKFTR